MDIWYTLGADCGAGVLTMRPTPEFMRKVLALQEALSDIVESDFEWKAKAAEVIEECGSELYEFIGWFGVDDNGEVRVAD